MHLEGVFAAGFPCFQIFHVRHCVACSIAGISGAVTTGSKAAVFPGLCHLTYPMQDQMQLASEQIPILVAQAAGRTMLDDDDQ